jgi:amino acid transporter
MSKQIKRSIKNQFLANIIPWLNRDDPGWRLNFNKLMNGLLLVLVVATWNATSASVSVVATFVFLCFVGLAVVAYYKNIQRRNNNLDFSVAWIAAMVAAGLILSVLFYFGNTSLHSIWSATLMFFLLVCLAAITTTQWFPNDSRRDSWNRDEIVPTESKSSSKEKTRTRS